MNHIEPPLPIPPQLAIGSISRRSFLLGAAGSAIGLLTPRVNGATDEGFSFFHISDTHLDPRPGGETYADTARSVRTLQWIWEASRQPVVHESYEVATASPAFVLHTGDVFEYGTIGRTWEAFDLAFGAAACPIRFVPGNHDNTWCSLNRATRGRFGGDSFSFDHGGCHFILLNSTGLLDPRPCFDRRTLDWLRDDLAGVDTATPIILALHHPLTGNAGYASDFEKLRLWEVVKHHHVALILDGHYHTVQFGTWQGIDRTSGGATFGRHTGYSTVTVRGGRLFVTFRYELTRDDREDKRLLVPLLQKPLALDTRTRRRTLAAEWRSGAVHVKLSRLRDPAESHRQITCWIDGESERAVPMESSDHAWSITLQSDLTPGMHFVQCRVEEAKGVIIDEAAPFEVPLPGSGEVRRAQLSAGVKAAPVVAQDTLVVADTSGCVTGFGTDLDERWRFETRNQIVHGLAAAGARVIVNDDAGNCWCIDAATGQPIWRRQLPHALLAAASATEEHVIVADAEGVIHTLHPETGDILWSKQVFDFAIECSPLVERGCIYAGGWDGFVAALDLLNGETLWRSRGPSGQIGRTTRYEAPADCAPVLAGGSLWVVDRGYRLGRYGPDGQFHTLIREDTAAIASDGEDGLLIRTIHNRFERMRSDTSIAWSIEGGGGRIPSPPVRAGARVASIADRGRLTIVDAASASGRIDYALTPSLYVHAPPVSRDGHQWFAADMDGVVTKLTLG